MSCLGILLTNEGQILQTKRIKRQGEKAKPDWVPFPENLKDHKVKLGIYT